MPKIETQFHWEPKKSIALAKLKKGVQIVENLKAGDEIIIVLDGVHIRDNKEWGAAEINISLQVSTKSFTKDVTIGTYTGIEDDDELISEPIVLLPSTRIEDHLNVAVTAIELDRAEGIFSKVPEMMKAIKTISEHIPVPGVPAAVKTASEIVASIVNIAGLINTDDAILHNSASYVIDEEKFPGLDEKFYLKAGPLVIRESNEHKEPTAIYLNVIKKTV